ncbi:MAG: isoprenyl transferase [Bacillota bacterium]
MSKGKEEESLNIIRGGEIPSHVAIIMDGNGRWARKRGLPRIAGHKAGMDTLREIISCAHEIGIKVMTFFAFSTENWKRPSWEVRFLMTLPEEYLQKDLPSLMEKNVVIKAIGDLNRLPKRTLRAVNHALQSTKNNTGMIVNFALNYGGRAEIVDAVRHIAGEVAGGELALDEINEQLFADHLYTRDIPDPDLLIRPSGELRISNFLLWQTAYTELWFTETFWPEFKREHFLQAIMDYQKRERRFGGIKK